MYPVFPVVLPSGIPAGANGKLTPCQLTPVYLVGLGYGSLGPVAARAWNALAFLADHELGVKLTASSLGDTYRSLEAQTQVFLQRYTPTYLPIRNTLADGRTYQGARWYKRSGVAAVASPGTSNHGLGLAIDVAIWDGKTVRSITSDPSVFGWLLTRAVECGFSWESQSEPWHLRYVKGDAVTAKVADLERWFAAAAAQKAA